MGASEIIFIFVVYLLLFGAKGVPSLARTLGKAIYQFRQASSDIQQEILNSSHELKQGVRRVENSVSSTVNSVMKEETKPTTSVSTDVPEEDPKKSTDSSQN